MSAETEAQRTAVPAVTRPRVAFYTRESIETGHAWSGTTRFMAESLERHLGPVEPKAAVPDFAVRANRLAGRVLTKLMGRNPLEGAWDPLRALSHLAARFAYRSAADRPDVCFMPVAAGLVPQMPRDLPVVYLSDGTVRCIFAYYRGAGNVPASLERLGERDESAAIARANLLIYPSEWAARSAREDYGADPAKIRVVPFGSNLAALPDLGARAPREEDGTLRLVLVSNDWQRKGGQVALDAVAALRARGIDARLTVVGANMPAEVAGPGIEVTGFVDKRTAEGQARFDRLMLGADIFFLPVSADAFGIVFTEAAAYGLPSVTTVTGGLQSLVLEGETGLLLPEGAPAEAYADALMALHADPVRRAAMGRAARERAESVLNWDAWGRSVAGAVRGMLAARDGGG
ncbi:MAG: glycosyltransferase family 4 protein [Pseudomonadota bacterium]